MTISPLRGRPEFADTLADRAWHAWWTESGVSLASYRAHLDPMMEGQGIPLALVAHEGDTYLGSVLLIESDLDARPHNAPWIAALWVEPERRRQGIAAQLMEAARVEAGRLGHASCYCAPRPTRGPTTSRKGSG